MVRMDVYKLCLSVLLISEIVVLYCNCQTTTLTPVDPDVVEGSDITIVCTVSSAVGYVNWQLDTTTSYSTTMSFGIWSLLRCSVPSTSFLKDTTKYSYTCTNTKYGLTVKNVQRSQHNDVWSCFPKGQSSGPKSTIHVQIPVVYVLIAPSLNTVDVIENTAIVFVCRTSASRPDASVTWYKVENVGISQINQNISSITTDDDFSVTTSTLRYFPSREQHGVQIYCKTENTINTSPKLSGRKTLNVLYQGDHAITEGNEYRVIENTQGQLSCTVNGGNPTPTLTWNCNVLSPIVSDSSNNGVITKTLTWTAVRGSDTLCSCTSQQTGFSDRIVTVTVAVLYTPDRPTDLRHDEAKTTASSIYITWKPGNNGGLPQTFHIKYKKGSTDTWNYINVTETGDFIMSYSITGLSEKTMYDIVLYATNELGNSNESNVYTALTKENEESETSSIVSVVGYSVGATLGFVILVVLSICLVWRCRSRRAENGNKTISSSVAQRRNETSTNKTVYQNEESVSNYDSLEMTNRDVSN